MIISNRVAINLDVPNDPNWARNGKAHTIEELDFGQLKVVVYKSTDCVLHVDVADSTRSRFVRVEIDIGLLNTPVPLQLEWGAEGVSLTLDKRLPIVRPWRALQKAPDPSEASHLE